MSFDEVVARESPVPPPPVWVDVVGATVEFDDVVAPPGGGVLAAGPASWLTELPGPFAPSELSDGGGVPADGSGVPVEFGSVGFEVGVVEGVEESGGDAGPESVGAGLVLPGGGVVLGGVLLPCVGGGSRPGGEPEFIPGPPLEGSPIGGGRPPPSDDVGEDVGSEDVGSPGAVFVSVTVGSPLAVVPPMALGCEVSVGVHVGVPELLGAEPASPGASMGTVSAGGVGAELTLGLSQGSAFSPALAPLPGRRIARVTAAATHSAAMNAPPSRLRRVMRPSILCVHSLAV